MQTDSPIQPAGFCPHCGYAINPGLCPECGRDVPAKHLAKSATAHKRMGEKFARRVAVAIGLAHLIAMLHFWTGPELAPMVVYFVDIPVAALFHHPDETALLISLLICSVLYPTILYMILRRLLAFRK